MEWTVWEGDGLEVSEAIDGFGLMQKTISIPACRKILIDKGNIPHGEGYIID